MKYKVGDKVRIVQAPVESMPHKGYHEWLGKVMTIRQVCRDPRKYYGGGHYYYMEEYIYWTWTKDMIECLVGNSDNPLEAVDKRDINGNKIRMAIIDDPCYDTHKDTTINWSAITIKNPEVSENV